MTYLKNIKYTTSSSKNYIFEDVSVNFPASFTSNASIYNNVDLESLFREVALKTKLQYGEAFKKLAEE